MACSACQRAKGLTKHQFRTPTLSAVGNTAASTGSRTNARRTRRTVFVPVQR